MVKQQSRSQRRHRGFQNATTIHERFVLSDKVRKQINAASEAVQ
jgi:hypothetical protein